MTRVPATVLPPNTRILGVEHDRSTARVESLAPLHRTHHMPICSQISRRPASAEYLFQLADRLLQLTVLQHECVDLQTNA